MDNNKLTSMLTGMGLDPTLFPASDAANWCITALHPANEVAGPVTGVPDLNSQPTMVIQWRQIDQISPPAGVLTSETWDCEVAHYAGPQLLMVYRIKKTADTAWEYHYVLNREYNFNIVAPTLGPNIFGGNQGSWSLDTAGYRCMYASTTCTTNAASLSDQGIFVGGQIADPSHTENLANVSGVVADTESVQGMTTPTPWRFWFTAYDPSGNSPLPDFTTLPGTCKRGASWRAKDGYYMPLRHANSGGSFPWLSSYDVIAKGVNPWQSTGMTPPPFVPNGNMQVGIAAFRGLASTTTLSMFTRIGYECVIDSTSNYRAFTTPSCEPNFLMIEEYYKLSQKLGDVYPAEYNSKDLLTGIISHIAKSLPPPMDAILPMLSELLLNNSSGIKKMAGKAGNMLGLTKKGKPKDATSGRNVDTLTRTPDSTVTETLMAGTESGMSKSQGRGKPKPVRNTVKRVTGKK